MLAEIKVWANKQADVSPLATAIRRLVEIGLGHGKPSAPYSKKNAKRAKQLAAKTIANLVDPTAPAEQLANRKWLLLKGPEEFREARIDCVKT
jgi:hypothetical protein